MKSVSSSGAKKKKRAVLDATKQARPAINPGPEQAQVSKNERLFHSPTGLLAHATSLPGRQDQILQLQRKFGNGYVQRLIANHDKLATPAVQRQDMVEHNPAGQQSPDPVQRDAAGNALVIEDPLVVSGDPKFYHRAERVNKKYAAHPPSAGWPFTAELKHLWAQGAYDDFADAVREFQYQNLGEKAADGILGPETGKAIQASSGSEAETGDPAVANEGPSSSTPKSETQPQPATGDLETAGSAALRERFREIQALLAGGTLSPDEQTAFAAEAELVKEALIDAITGESIQFDLAAFNNISVQVPANGKIVPLTVRAAYFIHKDLGVANVKSARKASNFSGIQKALKENGGISLMQTGKGKAMDSGFAIEYGKGTPADVRLFIQEAINSGAIEKYARSKKKITKAQSLGDLDAATLHDLTQQWIYDNGVGVDCSGFVVQTQVNAREKVRAELAGLGVSATDLPPEISSKVRNAKSFKSETAVGKPSDLRPGDAWVTPSGGHIRLVTGVRQTTRKGKAIIEFDTAESSGDSTSRERGQISKTNKTGGLDDWGRIKGSFHRL